MQRIEAESYFQFVFLFLLFLLKNYLKDKEMEKETQQEPVPAGSFPRCLQQLGLDQTKARSQEFKASWHVTGTC